eukprot:4229866-Prymnesium_polylepis.2
MSMSLEPLPDSSAARSTASPESSAMFAARNLVSSPLSPHRVSTSSIASCWALRTPTQGRLCVQHGVRTRPAHVAVIAEVDIHKGAVSLQRAVQSGLEFMVLPVERVVSERKLCERRVGLEHQANVHRPRRGDIRCKLRASKAEHAKRCVIQQRVAKHLRAGRAQPVAC